MWQLHHWEDPDGTHPPNKAHPTPLPPTQPPTQPGSSPSHASQCPRKPSRQLQKKAPSVFWHSAPSPQSWVPRSHSSMSAETIQILNNKHQLEALYLKRVTVIWARISNHIHCSVGSNYSSMPYRSTMVVDVMTHERHGWVISTHLCIRNYLYIP